MDQPDIKAAIVACHQQHPTWKTTQIATAVNCSTAYVRQVAAQCELPIRSRYGRPRGHIGIRRGEAEWMLSAPG